MRTPGYYVEPQYLYYTWVREINAGKFELQHVMDGIATFERVIAGAKDAEGYMNLFSTMNLNDPALGADLNMQSRNISSLIMLFEDLSIIELQQNDVIGDAYEYLIGNFAMESGKKAGEFYIHNGDTLAEDWPEDPERPDEGRLFDAVVMIISSIISSGIRSKQGKPFFSSQIYLAKAA